MQSAPLCEVPAGGPHLQLLAGIPGVTALIHPGTPPPQCLTPAFACGLNVFRLCLQKPLCQRKPADALSSLLCYFLSGFLFFLPHSRLSEKLRDPCKKLPCTRSPFPSYVLSYLLYHCSFPVSIMHINNECMLFLLNHLISWRHFH